MALTDLINNSSEGFMTGGLLGLFLGLAFLAILIGIAMYVYFAIVWQTIAKRQKHKNPWFAWVPILNFVLVLQLGGFHWALIFLILVPILGWLSLFVLIIISYWRIFEKEKYPGWFGLAPLADFAFAGIGTILLAVALGFVTWKPKTSAKKK